MGLRFGYMHDIAYFQIMLLGGWLATRSVAALSATRIYIATAAILLTYFTLKFVMVVEGRFSPFYGLLHALVFAACGLMFLSFTDQRIIRVYRAWAPTRWLIPFVASMTLETYLVHSYLIEYSWLSSLRFPLNIAVLIVLTLVIAWGVSRLSKSVRERSKS
jgi:hypothetical protein